MNVSNVFVSSEGAAQQTIDARPLHCEAGAWFKRGGDVPEWARRLPRDVKALRLEKRL
jgi:hypothetical protein